MCCQKEREREREKEKGRIKFNIIIHKQSDNLAVKKKKKKHTNNKEGEELFVAWLYLPASLQTGDPSSFTS